jgi:hypothetical protein
VVLQDNRRGGSCQAGRETATGRTIGPLAAAGIVTRACGRHPGSGLVSSVMCSSQVWDASKNTVSRKIRHRRMIRIVVRPEHYWREKDPMVYRDGKYCSHIL